MPLFAVIIAGSVRLIVGLLTRLLGLNSINLYRSGLGSIGYTIVSFLSLISLVTPYYYLLLSLPLLSSGIEAVIDIDSLSDILI